MLFSVIDAMGKPASGIMDGHLVWLGSYDECVAIEATVNTSGAVTHPYKGRYCKPSFKIGSGQVKPCYNVYKRLVIVQWFTGTHAYAHDDPISTLKAPPIICSRRQLKIFPLFQKITNKE